MELRPRRRSVHNLARYSYNIVKKCLDLYQKSVTIIKKL